MRLQLDNREQTAIGKLTAAHRVADLCAHNQLTATKIKLLPCYSSRETTFFVLDCILYIQYIYIYIFIFFLTKQHGAIVNKEVD